VTAPLRPDPEEVAETAFVTPRELERRRAGESFSAWFGTVLDAARPVIREVTGGASGW
jgi:isopentenyl-diphosphate delta-isomerase